MSARPRVLSIPAGVAFLPALVDALFDGSLVEGFVPDPRDPFALIDTTVYLPTRRAARALAALVAQRFGERPAAMPRIVPLGDVEGAEFEMAAQGGGMGGGMGGQFAASLAPAVPETERRLLLAGLILAWSRTLPAAIASDGGLLEQPLLVPASPADALALSADMSGLMDDILMQDVDWADLGAAAEARYDRYYAITVEFLRIASEHWPHILAARGAGDPSGRRHALLRAEAERLAQTPPKGPIIAAGSTGSVPSTARLLAAIARLPRGAVVLPGLDRAMDDDTLRALTEDGDEHDAAHSHPQATLMRLLPRLGIHRRDVDEIGVLSAPAAARGRFLAEALRPSETTEMWATARLPAAQIAAGLAGLTFIEAADEREEALAVAIALREALERPGAVAALVTPDRTLAERVCAELKRWNIDAEDSAGTPLSRCLAGGFAQLVAQVVAEDFEAVALLSLLAHPLARFGFAEEDLERARVVLEIGVLRGPKPPAGLDGLDIALAAREAGIATDRHAPRPARRLTPADWALARDLLERLRAAFAPLLSYRGAVDADILAVARDHRLVTIAAADERSDRDRLFAGEDGRQLCDLFDELSHVEASGITGTLKDYPAFFARLCAERTVRGPGAQHRRVKIWGLLEARLLEADRIVLGGLAETVWPPAAQTDAFLNRPMRQKLGLPPPEARLGQTAHDVVQALGTHDAILTRSLRREGKPTVPSRFIQRMKAYAGEGAWAEVTRAGEHYLSLARHLSEPRPEPPLPRPAPRPDPALQPRSLSVSEIETLVRDPYAIYARHVLKLDPLDRLAVQPGAADRGTIVHDAFACFAREWPQLAPERRLPRLIEIGREAFAPVAEYPDVHALWWPRFERLAPHVIAFEQERRAIAGTVLVETSGRLDVTLCDGTSFQLRVRADRIELRPGGAAIIDFKTGQPPTSRQVGLGFAPQLTLEAEMLARGGFAEIPRFGAIEELVYVKVGNGADPLDAAPVRPAKDDHWVVADLPAAHFAGLVALLDALRSGERGFASRPFAEFAGRQTSYDHLARVKEWSALGDPGEEGE